MLHSPTSSLGSSSTSSSASNSTLQPEHVLSASYRRRSVDNGGLNLALNDHSGNGTGRGWGGWQEDVPSGRTDYAELVLAMHEQTATAIDHAYPATSTALVPSLELKALRKNLIHKLASWSFDASHLSANEVLVCTCLLFESLWSIEGMEDSIGIGFGEIPAFLAHISKIYRSQTSYHNFQHALDVLQAVYCYLHEAGCVPSVEILLDDDEVADTLVCQFDEGKGRSNASSAAEVMPTAPRRQKMWRKPPPEEGKRDTLLRLALRNQDLFALYVAGVGHDIGHPGLSNKFLSNAKAPLAELFDDVSVLEKFHCTVLLQVMRNHNMVHLLDRKQSNLHDARFMPMPPRPRTESDPGVVSRTVDSVFPAEQGAKADVTPPGTPSKILLPTRPTVLHSISAYPAPPVATVASGTVTEFRVLLMKTILATDMNVHFQWMPKMDDLLQKMKRDLDLDGNEQMATGMEEVDSDTRLLLCQALIKCADISNPSRPPPICTHWSLILMSEWMEQEMLEKQLELPISVTASNDPIEAAKGQIGFIRTFTRPLLEATCAVIPELHVFVKQCDANLAMWESKIQDFQSNCVDEGSQDSRTCHTINDSPTTSQLVLPTSPPDVSTMFALSLPSALHTPNSESRGQPPWPEPSSSPPLGTTQSDATDLGHNGEGRVITPASQGSRPSSPPSHSAAHHRHPSHTQLPQVSIPAAASTSFSPSNSQHAKSSSTASASASSPLFSPRSIPTSSSSPRSDVSGGSVSSTVGLQFRPGLRAAYEANCRPKAIKRLENRSSWQGSVAGALAAITPIEPLSDPPAPGSPFVPNGS